MELVEKVFSALTHLETALGISYSLLDKDIFLPNLPHHKLCPSDLISLAATQSGLRQRSAHSSSFSGRSNSGSKSDSSNNAEAILRT